MNVRGLKWLFALAASLLAGLLACSGNSPSGPTDDGTPSGLDLARARSASISMQGGSLETTSADGFRYELVVPPGAVSAPTVFTITPYVEPTGADSLSRLSPGLYLEPSGLTFEAPVALVVDLPQPLQSTNPPTLVLSGENGAHDVILPTTVSGQTLTAPLAHFSSVSPSTPSQADLQLLWDTVLLEIDTFGESIERIETLVSLYLFTLNSGQYASLPVFPDWPDAIHRALVGILAFGANQCATGKCIDGSHTIFHARNLSSAMLFSDLETVADAADSNCNQPWLGIDLTYPSACEPIAEGDQIGVTVTVMSPSAGPVNGAAVSLSLSGSGTLSSSSGTTDTLGEWHTTLVVGSFAGSSPPILIASIPQACDPTFELRRPVDSWAVGDTTGTLRFELEEMWVASAVCCGPGDDEKAMVRHIQGNCVPPLGPGGQVSETTSVIAPWGATSNTSTVAVDVGSFSVGGGRVPSNSGSGDMSINGRMIYGNPGGRAFGPAATLRVSLSWSNASIGFSMMSGGVGSLGSTWPAGSAQIDIPLTEGSTGFVMGVSGYAAGGGGRLQFECLNCP